MATLYVVATPIGNLDDITIRALEVLRKVEVVGVETPNVARKLFSAYGIHGKKLIVVREVNRNDAYNKIRSFLDNGEDVAVISDAGTPGISDPGYDIVNKLLKDGYRVVPIPGPSALTAVLSVFPLREPWVFLGFLPKRKGKRKKVLQKIFELSLNFVFYESPYKILDTMNIISEIMPNVEVCIAREITKKFEEFIVGSPGEIVSFLEDRETIKGEIVCAVNVDVSE